MSAEDVGTREVAYRLFAAEFDDADFAYSESDEERAPNYVITPTGARVNRLFVVGVLTEVEPVNEEMLRARVVDPTGAFVIYAGQYQPDALAYLERADPPSYVAVTGKARTFQPDDGDQIYTSIRPETISTVDAATRDRWTVRTAALTIDRIETIAAAIDADNRSDSLADALRTRGVAAGLATGIPLAIEHYGTTPTYLAALRDLARDTLLVVTGEREEADPLRIEPAATGEVTAAELARTDLDLAEASPDAEPIPAGGPVADEMTPESTGAPTDQTEEAAVPSEDDEPAATETGAGTADEMTDEPTEELGDFDAESPALDADERQEVEETYGTEFETGAEVGEPGEADIEGTPTETGGTEPSEPDGTTEPESTPVDDEPSTDDLEEAALAVMRELDDGDGAPHDAVVDAVADASDVDRSVVESAIQEALMDGECYEPADGRLKAI